MEFTIGAIFKISGTFSQGELYSLWKAAKASGDLRALVKTIEDAMPKSTMDAWNGEQQ